MKFLAPVLVFLLGILPSGAGESDFSLVLGKQTDSMEFAVKDKTLEVRILSPGGIGRLELGIKKEGVKWPESVVLFLQSKKGKPLKELEGISISGKTIRIKGSRRTSGRMDCHDVKPGGQPVDKLNPRKVKVTVKKTAGAMVVTIPGSLLAGETGIRIQWIDFYR
jgi:hypothetical protein